ncbi:MAG: hypothetical protein RKR03_12200 [Candidatus Competibacter sp.]|nr:hypothetical protein [Candidatus Competibacter sp.]
MRRIRPDLHQPTRDGDDTLYLLTTVPATAVDACTLARLFRERWTLENAFGGSADRHSRASPIAQVPQAFARTQEAAREADPRSPPTSCVHRPKGRCRSRIPDPRGVREGDPFFRSLESRRGFGHAGLAASVVIQFAGPIQPLIQRK